MRPKTRPAQIWWLVLLIGPCGFLELSFKLPMHIQQLPKLVVKSQFELEISCGRNIYPMEIHKHYGSGGVLFCFLKASLLAHLFIARHQEKKKECQIMFSDFRKQVYHAL
jgi:hypothetical protein